MKPLRPLLLNWQISLRAREIAHAAIDTCKGELLPNVDDNHTPNCNRLKKQIEEFALQVKLARLQPPAAPPAFRPEAAAEPDHV
jgi:hypothetical protein